jgi:uncharacterized surface protein with fasciclin (FAS1) repeats
MKIFKTLTIVMIALVGLAFTANLNPEKTISEVVAERQDLSTLLSVLESAELVETLKGEGPYTVFAPTNEAFDSLSGGKTLDELKQNKEELSKILKYHVVSGEYYASDLYDGQRLQSLEGTEIKISSAEPAEERGYMQEDTTMHEDTTMMQQEQDTTTTGTTSSVKINNANVVEQDLEASNGIIHVIDAVIVPADVDAIGSVEDEF